MKAVWWSVIALSLLALAATWSVWSATCLDAAAVGYCESQPAVGWPLAAVITALAIIATSTAIVKLRRINYPDRLPTWTAH